MKKLLNYEVNDIAGNKFTVLVVDDDPGIRETMGDILNEMNFKVATANDGYQAIEMVQSGSFDAVVMDVKMPGLDGIEALKRIKGIKPGTRIILMTAYANENIVLTAKKEGASTVLYKPVDLDQVQKLLMNGK
ncbi:MAG: response regulator [Candidatus Sigynarchaeota archaeon]